MWFGYPIHTVDDVGVLVDIEVDSDKNKYSKAKEGRQKQAKEQQKENMLEFELAVENCSFGEEPTKQMVADYLGVNVKTIERRLENSKIYWYDKNTKTIKKRETGL